MRPLTFLFPLIAAIAGCDQLGIETPAQQLQRAEAEGRAIGSACRHSGRALEDCYQINKRASKAAIYAGWRDMDAYMRENAIKEVPIAGANALAPKKLAPPAESEANTSPPAPAHEGADKPAASGKKVSAASSIEDIQKSALAGRRLV